MTSSAKTHHVCATTELLDSQKPSQFTEELKSSSIPNINDTLMYCPKTSSLLL